jgi:AhpD family alkylhydroperoxidase
MVAETMIDFKTKEMIYVSVSIANSSQYCVRSHTAAAKAQGMTDEEHAELLRIITMAGRTNHSLNGLSIPVDDVFDMQTNKD